MIVCIYFELTLSDDLMLCVCEYVLVVIHIFTWPSEHTPKVKATKGLYKTLLQSRHLSFNFFELFLFFVIYYIFLKLIFKKYSS